MPERDRGTPTSYNLKIVSGFLPEDDCSFLEESLKYFMSAKDVFHQVVQAALEKDGWAMIKDPLFLKLSR